MKADVYDKNNKKVGSVELSDRLFAREWNPDLVHQALRVQTANRRAGTAFAKDRSEVRGGGRKPWRQKGTGRARHGSIRSPIWAGGGVTHGPTREKIFVLRLNKKMRQGAIFSVISRRLKEGEVKVIDSLGVTTPKTRELSKVVTAFSQKEPNALVISENEPKNVSRASRNIQKVKTISPKSLNVYDLLRYKQILLEKDAIPVIEKHYHAVK